MNISNRGFLPRKALNNTALKRVPRQANPNTTCKINQSYETRSKRSRFIPEPVFEKRDRNIHLPHREIRKNEEFANMLEPESVFSNIHSFHFLKRKFEWRRRGKKNIQRMSVKTNLRLNFAVQFDSDTKPINWTEQKTNLQVGASKSSEAADPVALWNRYEIGNGCASVISKSFFLKKKREINPKGNISKGINEQEKRSKTRTKKTR